MRAGCAVLKRLRILALLWAAHKSIYKLQYLRSNNNAGTTEIRLKELKLEAMQTTVSDGPQ